MQKILALAEKGPLSDGNVPSFANNGLDQGRQLLWLSRSNTVTSINIEDPNLISTPLLNQVNGLSLKGRRKCSILFTEDPRNW